MRSFFQRLTSKSKVLKNNNKNKNKNKNNHTISSSEFESEIAATTATITKTIPDHKLRKALISLLGRFNESNNNGNGNNNNSNKYNWRKNKRSDSGVDDADDDMDEIKAGVQELIDHAPAPVIGRSLTPMEQKEWDEFTLAAHTFLQALPEQSKQSYQQVLQEIQQEEEEEEEKKSREKKQEQENSQVHPQSPPPQQETDIRSNNRPTVGIKATLPADIPIAAHSPQALTYSSSVSPKQVRSRKKALTSSAAASNNKKASPVQNTTTTTTKAKPSSHIVDYLCIVDFMATCNDGPPPKPQEIIEFPAILLNVRTGKIEGSFHTYVQPDIHPRLSKYCTELTGISQSMVHSGVQITDALKKHQTWLESYGLISLPESFRRIRVDAESNKGKEKGKGNSKKTQQTQKTFVYTTCGDWDLKVCLPNQLEYGNQEVPEAFQSWINLKWPFETLYHKKARGIVEMLDALAIQPEFNVDSGLDDCRNLGHICEQMLAHGWVPNPTAGKGRIGTMEFWDFQRRRPWPLQPDPISPYKMIYLIRNGETESETNHALSMTASSKNSYGLTPQGIEKCKYQFGEILSEEHKKAIQVVISSPLKSAIQTAILGFPDREIVINYDLAEIGRERPENSTRPIEVVLSELRTDISSRKKEYSIDHESLKPDGWPNEKMKRNIHSKYHNNQSTPAVERVREAFEWMYMDCSEDVFAVVCHTNVIRTAIFGASAPIFPENLTPIRCMLFMNGNLRPI